MTPMNTEPVNRIAAVLLEVEFGQDDIDSVVSAAMIEPENFMVAKSSDRPTKNRRWLERRYELIDSTLQSFRVILVRNDPGDYLEIDYGFDTDMRYRTMIYHLHTPCDKKEFYTGLKRICEEIIPALVDKLDNDKLTRVVFDRKVAVEFHNLENQVGSVL